MPTQDLGALRIVRATVDDVPLLVPLFEAYRTFYDQPADREGATAFLRARLSKDESVVFLALERDLVVGFTQLYPSFSSVAMKRVWILNDLYVDPSARSRGVASALLTRAEAYAKETFAKGLVLETAKDNPAQDLYVAQGWKLNEIFLQFEKNV